MTDKKTIPTEPAPRQPLIITARITVPLMEYGNLTLEATQEIELPAECNGVQRSTLMVSGLELLKRDLALVILPMAEAEVERAKPNPEFAKTQYPDYWMRRNSSVYRWLRVAEPDLPIPAMQEIIGKLNVASE